MDDYLCFSYMVNNIAIRLQILLSMFWIMSHGGWIVFFSLSNKYKHSDMIEITYKTLIYHPDETTK